eukprot:TRINITY_DN17439_c0_g1_i1.p2 TRINITY_DN17439_c0_g1~~TRINITY_DN17439_c0_g1_i1.p2  ORF type:complete len:166 (-),score=36.13 TRINITY_DN17439_c0_g1_i1:557-1054(-)
MSGQRIKVGDRLPAVNFMTLKDGGPSQVSFDEVFKGKKVVLFGLPGAFTPGCSKTHCPSYVREYKIFKSRGIDVVACTAVNDCFVMDAWAKDQNATDILMLADGNAEFAKAIGITKDTGAFGGLRSGRYALYAEDGVVRHLGVDESSSIENSVASAIIDILPKAQ